MLKRTLSLTAVLALTAITVGCGTSSAATPKAQIQHVQRAYFAAMKADNAGAMCRLTSDQRRCLTKVFELRLLGLKPSDMLTGNEEHLIATLKVTVRGDHARTAGGNELVKRNGTWLIVLKG